MKKILIALLILTTALIMGCGKDEPINLLATIHVHQDRGHDDGGHHNGRDRGEKARHAVFTEIAPN